MSIKVEVKGKKLIIEADIEDIIYNIDSTIGIHFPANELQKLAAVIYNDLAHESKEARS